MSSLPIIDISPLYNNDQAALMEAAHAIDHACRTWGFFLITGHQIPKSRIEQLRAMAYTFFNKSLDEKMKIDITKSKYHRGYSAVGVEQVDPANPVDFKEMFDMNLHLDEEHPSVRAGRPLRGSNLHPDIPGWKELMEQHFQDMQSQVMVLLRALALAIGLDPSFFDAKFDAPLSGFRLIHYPAECKGKQVLGDHTDYGIVTLLYQDPCAGLQVRNLQNEWMNVPYVEGAFVVNIGDMMAMWSNDRYKSTHHRVLNPGVDRISMPFFCEPNPETVIECLPHCCDASNPAKYPPVSAVDWMLKRYGETYAYLPSTTAPHVAS